jgi:hypothetical protein
VDVVGGEVVLSSVGIASTDFGLDKSVFADAEVLEDEQVVSDGDFLVLGNFVG